MTVTSAAGGKAYSSGDWWNVSFAQTQSLRKDQEKKPKFVSRMSPIFQSVRGHRFAEITARIWDHPDYTHLEALHSDLWDYIIEVIKIWRRLSEQSTSLRPALSWDAKNPNMESVFELHIRSLFISSAQQIIDSMPADMNPNEYDNYEFWITLRDFSNWAQAAYALRTMPSSCMEKYIEEELPKLSPQQQPEDLKEINKRDDHWGGVSLSTLRILFG